MSTTTISRIPRYQPRQSHAHGVTTERTTSTLNIEEAGPLRTKSEFAQSSLVSAPGDVQPRAVPPAYSAGWHARSYSDVLMARMPPMPGALGETPARPTNETAETPSEDEGRTGKLVSAQVVTPVSRDAENTERKISFKFETLGDQVSLSKERTEDAGDGRHGNWITASKKHAAGANGVTCKREQNTDLTQEQENLVRRAETRLTESKRSRIEDRKDILSHPASNDRNSESHEVGPSKDKGKAPDPRNWVNANLADEDIETIADLAGSNEVPSVEHHHVFFGDMDLSEDSFKTTARQENPSSPSTRQSSRPMPNTNSAPAPLLRPLGNGYFVIPDRYRPNVTLLLTLDQICLYLQHDADLRGGAAPRSIPSPVGYDEFAVALNTNAHHWSSPCSSRVSGTRNHPTHLARVS
ncbi:hypothetical protein F4604DRAFT_1809750 [Suillus subluteus]|nr:hypothetical protein F4604DRAFT_1809750 [Suillus subluteus]